MRKSLLCIGLFLICSRVFGWGFWAHQRINYMACFTLPPDMFLFYKSNIQYISEHAVDPDKRRYSDPEEAPRHYMDLDKYGGIDSVPHHWEEAVARYSEDTLKAHGIVPWAIQSTYYKLVKAFRERDRDRILYYSAVAGHYIGDAHVPLHCTHNYNGQLTGQKGIHGFWESRLPELFGASYDYFAGRCVYIENPLESAWTILGESSAAVDSVLTFEKNLDRMTPPDQKYGYEDRGSVVVRTYSRHYARQYHEMLGGQVERRMRCAIMMVGSYWYSAWVDAGQPPLDFHAPEGMTEIAEAAIDSANHTQISKGRICIDD